jgi:dolichol-phosphate mannosyltransferase
VTGASFLTEATAEGRDASPGPELSVIVPVRDEADNIRPLIDEIVGALDGVVRYEIIYVDDGSRDATPAALDHAMREVAALRRLRHAASCGQSAAVLSGVLAARAPLIATLDGDGQNDPADLPRMLSAFREAGGPDRIQGVTGVRTRRQDNVAKRFASRIANAIRRRALKDDALDSGCGIRLVARAAFLRLPYFDHMHRFIPALMRREGFALLSLPVNHRPRARGRSKYGTLDRLWVGIVDLLGVMWLLRRRERPTVTSDGR